MKTTIFSIALVLGFAFATPSYDGGRRSDDDRDGHRHRDHCLSQQDVDSILSRWPRIFDGGQAGVDLITNPLLRISPLTTKDSTLATSLALRSTFRAVQFS